MTAAKKDMSDEFEALKDEESYARLAADFAALKHDLKTLKEDFSDFGAATAGHAKHNIAAGISSAEGHARDAVESATDELQEIQKQAERAIKKKPLTAVAAALAIGYFLSGVARR